MPQLSESSFLLVWPVLPAYRASAERLLGLLRAPTGAQPASEQTYEAASETWLALEFARVNWPLRTQASDNGSEPAVERIKALVSFSAHYGALNGDSGRPSPSPHQVDLCSVKWALSHAAVLDTVLTLNGALATGQVDLVDRQFEAMAACYRIGGSISAPSGLGYMDLDLSLLPWEHREKCVQSATAMLLNPNLGGTRMLRDGRERVAFQALYELLHSQMAAWCARAAFGQCDGCGGFFPRTDGRQKYCPALLGQKESRCAMRDRSRRRRGGGAPLRRKPMELLLRQNAITDEEVTFEMASDLGSA